MCHRDSCKDSEHDFAAAQLATAAAAHPDDPGDDLWDWDAATELSRQCRAAKRKLVPEVGENEAVGGAETGADDAPDASVARVLLVQA